MSIEIIVPEWWTVSTTVASIVYFFWGGIFTIVGIAGIQERRIFWAGIGFGMFALVTFAILIVWRVVEFIFL